MPHREDERERRRAIQTGPQRTQLIAQILAQDAKQRPQQIFSPLEGFARTGAGLVDAFSKKRQLDAVASRDEEAQEAKRSDLGQVARILTVQGSGALPAGVQGAPEGTQAQQLANLAGRTQSPEVQALILQLLQKSGQQEQFRPLGPEQVAAAGLASGTAAQRNVRTGEIDVTQQPRPAGPERKIVKDAAGRQRFADTGELAFPDVEAETPEQKFNRELAAKTEVEAEKAAASVQRKLDEERPKAQARLSSSLGDIASTRDVFSRLTGHKGLDRATGLSSSIPLIPGSPAADFDALLTTAKARLGFAELAKMRQSSPTGGALGAISEKEITFLQAANQSLERAQSQEQIVDNFRLIDESLQRLEQAQQASFEGQFGIDEEDDSDAALLKRLGLQ